MATGLTDQRITATPPRRTALVALDHLRPFWVSGLALLCFFAGRLLFGRVLSLRGETYEWALYLALGTVFPVLILILSVPIPALRPLQTLRTILHEVLANSFVAICIYWLIDDLRLYLVLLSALQAISIGTHLRRAQHSVAYPVLLLLFPAITISWLGATRLLWWGPAYDDWILGSPYSLIIFIVVFVLSNFLVFGPVLPSQAARVSVFSPSSLARSLPVVLLVGILALRTFPLIADSPGIFFHWGAIVGPAQLVRQGGWLLWDVPSQYGFLSTLSIALMPRLDVWQSLFVLTALFLFLVACFVFFIFRSVTSGCVNYGFSLTVAIAAVFLIPGSTNWVYGIQVTPQSGPFRFIWCFALLAILLWEAQTSASSRWYYKIPLFGCLIWVVGTLWSPESAVYCAAIWLPSYALITLRHAADAYGTHGSMRRGIRLALWEAALPLFMLTIMIAVIVVLYRVRLGHGPDARALLDYVTSSTFSVVIDFRGPVSGLFMLFCAISTLVTYMLLQGIRQRVLPLLVGAWAVLWVTSSYFVGLSAANRVTDLSPIMLTVVGIILYVLSRAPVSLVWATAIRIPLVPLLTVLVTLPLGNGQQMVRYITRTEVALSADIEVPVLDHATRQLLEDAGVKPNDAIVYISNDLLRAVPVVHEDGSRELMTTREAWIPLMPFNILLPMRAERSARYVERFIERNQRSGWLLQCRSVPVSSFPWLTRLLLQWYVPTKMFENEDMQLMWLEYRGRGPEAGRGREAFTGPSLSFDHHALFCDPSWRDPTGRLDRAP